MSWPDAVDAASAADADAAATVSSTISRIPCPSKSGCSSARWSSARSNENVTASESMPASTFSRSERSHATRTSCGSLSPDLTERIRSSGSLEASASSISSRVTVTVAASGRPPTSSGVPTSMAVAPVPVPSMEPPFVDAPQGSGTFPPDGRPRRDLPVIATIVTCLSSRYESGACGPSGDVDSVGTTDADLPARN